MTSHYLCFSFQEAVYPLYTMVFIFHAMCVIFMVISRPFLSAKLLPQRGRNAIYAALYFLPGLSIIHATVGGIVHAIYQVCSCNHHSISSKTLDSFLGKEELKLISCKLKH